MNVIETNLPGVRIIEPTVHADDRGYFLETYREAALREAGIAASFVQDNHSGSRRHALRGLHYQLRHPQAKLCRVVRGEVLDVAVDIRRGSPTFGQYESAVLSETNHRQIFIPRGFAHGYVVLSERADFLYKCDDYYDRTDDCGIAWNEPVFAIDWRVDAPILSPKDQALPRLADIPADRLPVYTP